MKENSSENSSENNYFPSMVLVIIFVSCSGNDLFNKIYSASLLSFGINLLSTHSNPILIYFPPGLIIFCIF